MKSLFKIFFSFIVLCLIIAGCKKDTTLTVLEKVSFTGPISASKDTVILVEADSVANVITFNWPAVKYPTIAPVTYSLQVTTTDDVTTWAKAATLVLGNDVVTANLLGKQLNALTKELGLEPGVSKDLVFRIKSFVDREAYSETVTITVTPYEVITGKSLWVPGAYQGWSPSTAPTIYSPKDDGVYEGYLYLPVGEIKLTAQPDWTPSAFGDGGSGVLIHANYAGGNFSVGTEGYYLIAADTIQLKYLLVKTTWSIIGDATPGGWGSDTQLTYDQSTKLWTVTCDMVSTGSYKFRANNAWVIDFGVDADGKLQYADHPWHYVNQNNITVPSSGNYTITLDLSKPNNYTYSAVKN